MTRQSKMSKKLSPAIFGIALLCFSLPWITVSCEGKKVARFSGIQLVTGTTIKEPQVFGPAEKRKVGPEPFAVLAFVAAIAGLGIAFLKEKKGTIGSAVVGSIGTVLLLLLKSKLDNDILREGDGMLQLDYGAGFYLTLVLFLFAIGVNVYSIMKERGFSLPQIKGQDAGYKFCSQCGAKVESNAAFCGECGHSLK